MTKPVLQNLVLGWDRSWAPSMVGYRDEREMNLRGIRVISIATRKDYEETTNHIRIRCAQAWPELFL